MARRGSEFHFAPYHMDDENDCQAFRNALSSLLKQISLSVCFAPANRAPPTRVNGQRERSGGS